MVTVPVETEPAIVKVSPGNNTTCKLLAKIGIFTYPSLLISKLATSVPVLAVIVAAVLVWAIESPVTGAVTKSVKVLLPVKVAFLIKLKRVKAAFDEAWALKLAKR